MLIFSTNTGKCPIRCWIFFHLTFMNVGKDKLARGNAKPCRFDIRIM